MNLSFSTIHKPEQVKMYNASVLNEMKLEPDLEPVLKGKYETDTVRGEMIASEFEKFYNMQVTKGRGASYNYDFFIDRLIERDLPCIFFMPQSPLSVKKDVKGVAVKFASLETNKDIIEFAKEYGLLGVLNFSFQNADYGLTVFEPLYWWKLYINHVKRLLKLYEILKKKHKNQSIDIIGELVNYKEGNGMITFEWIEGGDFSFYFEEEKLNDDEFENIDAIAGAYILTTSVKDVLRSAINVDFSDIIRSKDSEIGFRIKEVYSTDYLIGAIYYDLWNLISNDVEILFCQHCGRTFTKSGRKKYCNDSCKTMAYKERKKGEK
ncbi:hypothetical protein CN497_08940 [Priestia megaterium]|uniref:Uncharacterized protein n=1 Tax=Priestia megaterium TaxID=1404 RepID=A0AAE5UD53_PRIMG|nr:hypothetical protein [Priestia megaterium]PES40829.1 hypothetical protein CN497_08940 [Priestia megaterium]